MPTVRSATARLAMCAASSASSSAPGSTACTARFFASWLGPVVVEPLVDLLAPTPLRERLLGGLRAPAQFGVQADHQLHDERRRRGLRCGSGLLADGQRTHVQAAVDELGPDGGERQAVALHRLDDARFERPPIGVAQEGGERPEPVVGGLQFPLARCRRLERHGGWRGLGWCCRSWCPLRLATDSTMSGDCRQDI